MTSLSNGPIVASRQVHFVVPAPRAAEHDQDLVTLVVPACNEEGSITGCLRSLLAQDWPALEVLVVDGASTHPTADIVSRLAASDPRIRLLRNERKIIPVSLNIAPGEARGRWLVRVDAHASLLRTTCGSRWRT